VAAAHLAPCSHIPNAWVHSTTIIDEAGHEITVEAVKSSGAFAGAGPEAIISKLSATYNALVVCQPAELFWLFQGFETAVFLGLAFAMAGFCFWWVRRRVL